jgi:isopenicillin N synthase-like dioxygenase
MKQIPVVDLSVARTGGLSARQSLAREIDQICREIGFFTITGHGVPVKVMDILREKAHAFFALPLDEKRKAIHQVLGTPRGYRALGGEALAHGNDRVTPPDLKEFYHIGRASWPNEPYYTSAEGQRYFIPNLWPREPAGFAEAASTYYAEMEKVVDLMMRFTALALNKEEHFFDHKINKHITAVACRRAHGLRHVHDPKW